MSELFSLPFMQRALLGGLLVGFLASYYGVFVVQRGLSFLGSGLAHAAFGGVALGLLLNIEPLWVAVPFTLLVALGIAWVHNRTKLGGDTAVGIFFSVAMALGILFLSLRRQYTADAFTYLFGSILAVSQADLILAFGVLTLTLLALPLWRRWSYAAFDRELAQADRLPVERDDYFLVLLIAVTAVVSIKIVGIVLIAAFLVIPAAAARLLARTFRQMTIISVAVGMSSALTGLVASYYLDVPSGPTIILLQAGVFFLAMLAASTLARL
ncbi:MAG: metal ABC transporter permease [candidate division KSB1 bacterium]|nr:metal ABC transporter permease [candidate division KSB1 bacterium]MDZ7293967.1 metal ABC transporter permease [candidate division KSB1 bacterium]MDZ7339097.1 metal ABC transporter permease [candidate division KSB1 bacterium]MDZ7385066.1 metal ABC transporter permease [candidate division KSB1 bacterium]MDZ7392604.1 metal ABC transporter permease [candidate division KSB1 bacterium]